MEGAMAEAPRKILIVEDEEDIRSLVRYNLEAEGFAVVDASDGERGLHLAATQRPSLIVLDLMLPGLSGLEVCRLLRAQEDTASVPILSMALAEDAALLDGLSAEQVQGLVIAGMATGTIPPQAREKVLGLATGGLPVVLCSGAASGWTAAEYYYPRAYDGLRAAGVVIENHLSARKTRLRLMLSLGLGLGYVPFGREFVLGPDSAR